MKALLKFGVLVSLLLSATLAFSEAAVEDLSPQDDATSNSTPPLTPAAELDAAGTTDNSAVNNQPQLTEQQRLSRLEQQMNNLTNMNLPQQVSELQQQIAVLRGQLQESTHELKTLNDQQKSFYQDLDRRLSQTKNNNTTNSSGYKATPSTSESIKQANQNQSASLEDSSAYQTAFTALTKKQYEQAATGFSRYVSAFPKGQYAANAHYWLGEIYLSQKNNDKAALEFKTVIDQFPQSVKVLDAQLKLADAHAGMGKIAEAKAELNQLKQKNPGSTAAQLASIRLQQLMSMKPAPVSTTNPE